MRALVVWESMYGNTRSVADALAAGLSLSGWDVELVHASLAPLAPSADLLVVAAPTHAFGLPTAASRDEAAATIDKRGSHLVLQPQADEPGVREWLDKDDLDLTRVRAAVAVDTRALAIEFAGHAAKRISRRLARMDVRVVGTRSFLIAHEHLRDGEMDRAQEWGRALAYDAVNALDGTRHW